MALHTSVFKGLLVNFIKLLDNYYSTLSGESHNISKSLLDETCGENILHDRIVGGKAAKLGQFPWIAMLLYKGIN